MAASFVKHIGTFASKTAGTTLAWLWPTSSSSGSLIVCYLVFDNFTTVGKPVVSSISKPAGETASWVFLGRSQHPTSTTSGAFSQGEIWAIKTTVAWTTPTITATFDSSVAMKSMGFSEFSTTNATLRSTIGSAYQTATTAATATTTGTAPVVGDLALGLLFQSNSPTVPLGDNDTTGGSWSAVQGVGSSGGGAATNNMGSFQYKVVTTTAHQTYNNQAVLTAGNGVVVAILQQGVTVTPVTSFSASATDVLNGGHVTFTDTTINSPTSWSWNFGTGASPATASTQGPHVVTYSTPGTSTVTLTATNSAGSDAADTPASITVSSNRYVQVADWTTPGTTSGSDQYKDVALTGLNAGDLLVAWGASNDWAAGTTRTITTSAGTTSAWTVNSPTPVLGADCDFVSGWATVTSGTTATVRVQIRGAPPRMGAGVWVIPAANWTGTPAFTHIGPTDVDGAVSTVVAGLSTVMVGVADWNALALSNNSTPAGALAGTNIQTTNYSVAARAWTAQAAGTRAYGLSGTSGADIVGTVVVVPTPLSKMEGLTDDFPGTTLNTTKWTEGLWNAATGTLVAGQAQIILTTGYSNLGAVIGRWTAADSSFYAKVTPPANIHANRNVGMYFYLPDNNNRITLSWFGTTTPTLKPNVVVGGTSLYNPSITYDPVSMAWWKVTFSGTNIYWYTSPDGTTWTQRWTYSEATLSRTNVLLRFEAGTAAGDVQTSVAYIDNVNVPGVAKMESLTDDFTTENTTKWPPGNRFGTPSWAGGRLVTPETAGGYSGVISEQTYVMDESSVFVQVELPAVLKSTTEVTFGVYDATNVNGLFTIMYVTGGLPYFMFRLRKSGSADIDDSPGLQITSDRLWWRIRLSGGNAYWDTSADGVAWTNRKTLATTLTLPAVGVELSTGQYTSQAPQSTGYFDNINVMGSAAPSVLRNIHIGNAALQRSFTR